MSSRYSHSSIVGRCRSPKRSARSARSRSSAATRSGIVGDVPVDGDGRAVERLEEVAELAPACRTGRPSGLLRRASTSVTRSPNSSRTWSSLPHSGGGCAPGGGGGAYGFIVANIWPMKPSGVQLSRPMVPPGRVTRTSSSATGLVVRREHDADAATGRRRTRRRRTAAPRRRPRASRARALRPRRVWRPVSSSSGVRSVATTVAPAARRGWRRCRIRQPTSRTRSPGRDAAGLDQDRRRASG